MRKLTILLALLASTPALAEMDRGGNVAWYADQVMRHHGPKRIGWYYSAAALWLGNPGSCVDNGSMVHLHPVVDTAKARAYNIPSVWAGIISPHPFYTARDVQTVRVNGKLRAKPVNWSYSYASVMSHTPWGRRVSNPPKPVAASPIPMAATSTPTSSSPMESQYVADSTPP